ncbi:FAD:protein FMN transferase [Algoriphagus hitonicola]|uniref:FAD:protein FMN transferase n=1 Tax=Algoriphagus hitonicola TaxID=435880 RepID=A0A1I2QHV3_9BACT|nr:FAD:protein FMN transferase [Algoriphagus hitonicola]SFG27992.1 thiamine biosynthesis lipoprotein [Algoriphagus hitonicola]
MQSNARKNIIYSLVLLAMVILVYSWRNREEPKTPVSESAAVDLKINFSGQTMGTSYQVTYLDDEGRDFQSEIDSLLVVFNQSLSTYIPDSELSRFNLGDTLDFELPYFRQVLEGSKEVFDLTDGAFDPTVGPLVNVWGFGPGGPKLKDSVAINNLLQLVGFDQVNWDQNQVRKEVSGLYLDFSAIAKGQGVDVVADFLAKKGIQNLLVEIGGELVARGVNDKGELWKVGVNRPEEEAPASELFSIIALENRGMATSGNYRNFYVRDSVKISHTIDPKTGYPVNHNLLSATVLADDCMTADAFATAMMVMGTEKAIALAESRDDIDVFLIYSQADGSYETFLSERLKPFVSFEVN